MRVLHLIHGFGGGGAERQLSYLAPALSAAGVEVHIGHVAGGTNVDRVAASTCTLHALPRLQNYDPRLYFAVAKLIRNLRPDLVQTWLSQMDVLGGIAASRAGVPHILSERNTGANYPQGLKFRLRKRLGCRAAAIVANSAQGLDYWRSGSQSLKLENIDNGVPVAELAHYRDLRRNVGIAAERLLYAGRFTAAKNVERVLEVFIAIAEQRRTITARFFGSGPLRATLGNRVRAAGLDDRISINEYTEDLWTQMAEAAVLVSLSAHEGQPNIALEAAAIGCPLVLSDIEAHREVFGDDAVLYPGRPTVEAAAAATLAAIDDVSASARRADVALQCANNHSIAEAAGRYKELYAEIAQQRTSE